MDHLMIIGANFPLAVAPLIMLFVYLKASKDQRRQLLVRGVIVLVLAVALAQVGGMIYNSPRPFVVEHIKPLIPHVADNGFPSDHTLTVSAIALLLAPFSLPAACTTMILAGIVGASRVGCHLHSVVDVTASLLFAIVANSIALLVVRPRHSCAKAAAQANDRD